jgi:hypothetical protein
VITAERLRRCSSTSDLLQIVDDLGYPVAPVAVDRSEWARGGIELPWRGEADLTLLSRLPHFDLFLLEGESGSETISQFLREYRKHNIATKSALLYRSLNQNALSIYDIDSRGRSRRLDVDFREPSSHAVDRLNLLTCPTDDTSMQRIYDRALDREALTRQFFQGFSEAVRSIATAIAESCPDESEDQVAGQALLVMSRLLFLQFLQKKGWLAGERRFLIDRIIAASRAGRSVVRTVLEPLFFGCLNTPVEKRGAIARRLGKIPYLNGGLFEPTAFERRQRNINLPNRLIESIVETVFERFDFSTDENDGAGLHIDPEMLGKVFESLMASHERLATGSFYTPRPIVEAVTRRAVCEWLAAGDPELSKRLVDGETIMGELARGLSERLDTITVLDPACGSGAFLLASLVEIERLHGLVGTNASRADLRRRIVEQSLHGVDLKPEAVRLCELRLWLAIVSASPDALDGVEPLPNLDRNILQGNSLIGPTDHLGNARADVYRGWLSALKTQKNLVDRYRSSPREGRPALARLLRAHDLQIAGELLSRSIELDEAALVEATSRRVNLFGESLAPDAERCRLLQERIRETRSSLERVDMGELDWFAYDVHFAPVLVRGGFSVVVGNPPWVRHSRIEPAARKMYADRFALFRRRGGSGFHQPDLALAFVERGADLAEAGGVVALLLPAKVANARYASAFRTFIERETTLIEIHDWTEEGRRWFDADTFPLAVTFRKAAPLDGSCSDIRIGSESFAMTQRMLRASSGSEWRLLQPAIHAVIDRIIRQHPSLEHALGRAPFMGVKTGNNDLFFLDGATLRNDELVTSEGIAIPLTWVCRCVRGRDVQRWAATDSQWMLWPPVAGWRNPPAWASRLADARGVDVESMRLAYVKPEHVGVQVVWKDVSRGMAAAVLPETASIDGIHVPVVANQTLYSIDAVSQDEAWAIASILNSTVAGALLVAVAERAKDAHYRYFGRTVATLPFPLTAWAKYRAVLTRLARRAACSSDAAEALDALVAESYEVSAAEKELLQRFLEARLDAR